eukprot:CAMPEP_0119015104 /NCGR_PEP_ID=MMETSP1176-20130426/10561_1 /TAXON_ID=265551 /ORGANISM="Synedropsis recta cf, Strain CCMP1620" /LENGTH=237 /DNA_ID=CAMNT_0006968371 /DNA_START=193 /DNA_END=906 /DNA_ORIENTATION=+
MKLNVKPSVSAFMLNLDNDSLTKPEFAVTKKLTETAKQQQQQRVCWCIPLAVSFLLMILLGATSLVTASAQPTDILLLRNIVVDESPIVTTESTTTMRASLSMAPTEAANQESVHFWMDSVLKPLLLEVGALALFQSVGAIPTLTKLLLTSRSVHTKVGWLRLLAGSKNTAAGLLFHKANKGIKWKSPRMVRRLADSVKRIYKSRSRLSAASDITHVIGDDAADNETKLSDNNTVAP